MGFLYIGQKFTTTEIKILLFNLLDDGHHHEEELSGTFSDMNVSGFWILW
jgi:hypothetical protein